MHLCLNIHIICKAWDFKKKKMCVWRWWFFNLIRGRLSRQLQSSWGEWRVASDSAPRTTQECKWLWSSVTVPQSGSPGLVLRLLSHQRLASADPLWGRPLVNWKNAILFYGIKNHCQILGVCQIKWYFCWQRGRLLNIWKLLQNHILGEESCFKDYFNQFALTLFSCCLWRQLSVTVVIFGKLLNGVFMLMSSC